MRKAALRLAILAAAALSAGCGDSWPKICQNELALHHEFNDALMKIVDEDSAKFYKEFYFEKMKTTWETLQKRKEMYVKSRLDNKQILDDFVREMVADSQQRGLKNPLLMKQDVLNRWATDEQRKNQINRLKNIMDLVEEFSYHVKPLYVSEIGAVIERRRRQLARINGLIEGLQREGKEAPNLEKVRSAPGTIFSGAALL